MRKVHGFDISVQTPGGADKVPELDCFECRDDLTICTGATWGSVETDRASEEVGVLGHAVEAGTERLPWDEGDVVGVDVDGSGVNFEHAEEGEEERGFPGARASYDANFLAPGDEEVDVFED